MVSEFIPAEPTEDQDEAATFWLAADSGIPFHPTEPDNIRVIAEKLGITVTQARGHLVVFFPAPYRQRTRARFCFSLERLAGHYGVEWPHLQEPR